MIYLMNNLFLSGWGPALPTCEQEWPWAEAGGGQQGVADDGHEGGHREEEAEHGERAAQLEDESELHRPSGFQCSQYTWW